MITNKSESDVFVIMTVAWQADVKAGGEHCLTIKLVFVLILASHSPPWTIIPPHL